MIKDLDISDIERELLRLGDEAVGIVKTVIDEYAANFKRDVDATSPRRTGGLARSIKSTQVNKKKGSVYGYSITFVGSPLRATTGKGKGYKYHDLAFHLNYHGYILIGSSSIADIQQKGFISSAETKLNGINNEINARWNRAIGVKK